ncbi:MAG: ATP synthase F0 subunit A [Deltaproteobacteria bacterium]|nr:MAG: ATP synthase F0 subunit A [Deltaproteobacteria bacterium]
MGEHDTWYDLLYSFPGFEQASRSLRHWLGRTPDAEYSWKWLMFGDSHWTLTHVFGALLVFLFVLVGAVKFRAAMTGDDRLVPPGRLSLRNVFELLTEATFNMMAGVMGEKNAKRFLPLIGSLALFILFSNLLALIPGFAPPTDTLKTNLALSVVVFLATHYYGVKEHGLAYFKHFIGPMPALAPLMLPIELISHIARPVSLALRLMGNMASDHKVVASFFALVPLLIPVPFLVLGTLVSVVQALVFCLLSTVYISMAVAHDH